MSRLRDLVRFVRSLTWGELIVLGVAWLIGGLCLAAAFVGNCGGGYGSR